MSISRLSMLLLATLIVGTLVSCGPNNADITTDDAKIQEATNTAVQTAVAGNVSDYETLYGTIAFSPEPYGVSWECFSKNVFSQVSCTIDKVEKSSTGYTAFVTMKACNAEELMADLVHATDQAQAESTASSADGASVGFADQAFTDLLTSNPLAMHDASLQLYFAQASDGTWVLTNEDVLLGSVLGGFDGRQEAV